MVEMLTAKYFKAGRGLRTETMMNNMADFGFTKGLTHFADMGAFGYACHQRRLVQLPVSQDCFVPLAEVRQWGQPTPLDNGQGASALHFGDQRGMALMAALAPHAHVIPEMTNKSVRESVAQLLGVDPAPYTSAKMSYDLRRLRLKGRIEPVPLWHAYRLTEPGIKAALFFTKLYQRLFPPGLAALLPDQSYPSPLAQALTSGADEIPALMDAALIVPVAVST